MNTTEQIQEIIRKNLPQEVGDNLKKVLEQGEKDAIEVVRLKEILRQETQLKNDYAKHNTKLKEDLAKHVQLQIREDAVLKREKDIDISLLNVQLAAEQNKTNFSQQLLNSLVRNTEVKKQVFGNNTKVTQDNQGYGTTHPLPFDKTETTTEE